MSSELRNEPKQASGYSSAAKTREAETQAITSSVYQNWAWNIHMGADNVGANARQVMEGTGVVIQTTNGGFMAGAGPEGENVTLITELTGAGPLSFCVLTVASTNDAQAVALRDQIWTTLKPLIGVSQDAEPGAAADGGGMSAFPGV
jgi:hypothetical protein